MGILLKINKRLSPNKRLNGKHIKNFNKCRTFNTTYSTLWLVGQYLYQMKYFYIRYIFVIIICSILLWGTFTEEAFKIEWFIYAQTFSFGVSVILSSFFVFNNTINFRFRTNVKFILNGQMKGPLF